MDVLLQTMKVKGWSQLDSSASIDKIEVIFKAILPVDYREFLALSNGGRLLRDCTLFAIDGDVSTRYTLTEFLSVVGRNKAESLEFSPSWLDEYDDGTMVSILPIGTTTAGEFLCINLTLQPIGQVTLRSFGNGYFLASSFSDYVEILERQLLASGVALSTEAR